VAYNVVSVSANEDATADFLLRGADLTGNADGIAITLTGHIRRNATTAATKDVIAGAGGRYRLFLTTTHTFRFTLTDTAGVTLLTMDGGTLPANTNSSFLISAHTATGVTAADLFFYINDVDVKNITVGPTAGTADFTAANHAVFATTGGGTLAGIDLADLRMFTGNTTASRIDFSVEANRRLFFDASNALVKPTADGTVVVPGGATLTPIVFFGGDGVSAATWHINKNTTAGGYTVTGALGAVADPPAGVDPAGAGSMAFPPQTRRFQHMLVR
jgi:hypothetical protein